MTRATIVAGSACAIMLVFLGLAGCHQARERDVGPVAATSPAVTPSTPSTSSTPSTGSTVSALSGSTVSTGATHAGLIYGRITTRDGVIHEGRLRWGSDEEALWSNYFNGFKAENPWGALAPKEPRSMDVFGIKIGWERQRGPGRPFMARFGDIARIEPRDRDIRVILKSGTVFILDGYSADDLADGVRVWDGRGGVMELGERQIRDIEFLSTARLDTDAPSPLHGTVRTRQGDFTGLVQWDREQCVGSDELSGQTADGDIRLRFDTIRSITRRSRDGSLVTLADGRAISLSNRREVGDGNRGIYVDEERYGRVLISWDAFERVDFTPGGPGRAYGDFPPGRPLMGTVVTRSGRRLAGRLVYDLDESETTETLDAPSHGIDYTVPFGLIASIVRPAVVTLYSGETLQLEPTGDLGEENAGMLIFVDGNQRPEYVPWSDVGQIDFVRP